jgi:hypothetical protein
MRNNNNNLDERVEVAVAEFTAVISDVVCDLEEEFGREFLERHRGGDWCPCGREKARSACCN